MKAGDTGVREKLAGLVDYQKDSVVSREIAGRPAGTISLFAFDRGQGLSPHSAPFDAFVYVVEGRAEIAIEDKTNVLDAGEMIVMPAQRQHAIRALDPLKVLLVMIRS